MVAYGERMLVIGTKVACESLLTGEISTIDALPAEKNDTPLIKIWTVSQTFRHASEPYEDKCMVAFKFRFSWGGPNYP